MTERIDIIRIDAIELGERDTERKNRPSVVPIDEAKNEGLRRVNKLRRVGRDNLPDVVLPSRARRRPARADSVCELRVNRSLMLAKQLRFRGRYRACAGKIDALLI